MRRRPALLTFPLVLALAAPLAAADKEKDKDKDKKGAAPAGVSAEDLARQADALVAAGDAAGAVTLLHKAAALPTASADVGLHLGRLLETTHDVDGAIDAYKAAADRGTGPAKGEALGRRAVLEEVRGMAASAETAKAALAADPAGAWPSVAGSRLAAREGRADEARDLAQKAIAANAGPAGQAALGRAEEAASNWAAAEAAYRAAGGTDGSDAVATTGLARVLRHTGRASEAAPLLEKVVATYPGAVEAYKESARVKIALNRGADAFADAQTAAALAENDPDAARVVQEATIAKALGYLAENQAQMAVQDLTALRDQHPDAAVVRVGLGRALAAARQADAAVVELTKATELDPKLAEAYYHLGLTQHSLKRDAVAAAAAFEKAAAAEPANLEYRARLGAALLDAKQFDRAVTELTRVTSDPAYTRGEAWVSLGAAQLGAKKYKDAIAALDKANAIAPDNAQVEAYLAWCYFGLKDAAQFKAHGGKAKALGHKEPTLLQYLGRIEAGEPIK